MYYCGKPIRYLKKDDGEDDLEHMIVEVQENGFKACAKAVQRGLLDYINCIICSMFFYMLSVTSDMTKVFDISSNLFISVISVFTCITFFCRCFQTYREGYATKWIRMFGFLLSLWLGSILMALNIHHILSFHVNGFMFICIIFLVAIIVTDFVFFICFSIYYTRQKVKDNYSTYQSVVESQEKECDVDDGSV